MLAHVGKLFRVFKDPTTLIIRVAEQLTKCATNTGTIVDVGGYASICSGLIDGV